MWTVAGGEGGSATWSKDGSLVRILCIDLCGTGGPFERESFPIRVAAGEEKWGFAISPIPVGGLVVLRNASYRYSLPLCVACALTNKTASYAHVRHSSISPRLLSAYHCHVP